MKEVLVLAALGVCLFSGFYASADRGATPPTPPRPEPPAAKVEPLPPAVDVAAITAKARTLVDAQVVVPLSKARERRTLFSRAGPSLDERKAGPAAYELDTPAGPVVTGTIRLDRNRSARLRVDTRSDEVRLQLDGEPPVLAKDHFAHFGW